MNHLSPDFPMSTSVQGLSLPHADSSMECLGCWRASDTCESYCKMPKEGVLLGGWAYRAATPIDSPLPWKALLGQVECQVITDRLQEKFLLQCMENHLCCWIVGKVEPLWSLSPMVIYVFAHYFVGSSLQPAVTDFVAQSLCKSTFYEAISIFFTPPSRPTFLTLTGSELLLPNIASSWNTDDVQSAALFAMSAEAASISGETYYTGLDAMRLGDSRFSYNLATATLNCHTPSRSQQAQRLRGCLIVGVSPKALLKVARLVLSSTSPSLRSLILCSREELPFVALALKDKAFVASTVSSLNEADCAVASVVLTTIEVLDSVDGFRKLTTTSWHRLVSIGWPKISWRLCHTALSILHFDVHLALTTMEAMQEDAAMLESETVAHLLGLSYTSLNEPIGLAAALGDRVLYMRGMAKCASVQSYKVWVASQAQRDEQVQQQSRVDSRVGRLKQLLFRPFCEITRKFPLLQVATPALHFASLGGAINDYAQAAMSRFGSGEGRDCPICFEEDAAAVTRCGHRYCESCLQQALQAQQLRQAALSCPACREPLAPQRDIVVLRTSLEDDIEATPIMLRLLEEIASTGGRKIVVASYGDVHERLASWLRRRGRSRTWAWRGNTQHLLLTAQRFHRHHDATLLIDPATLSLHFASFENVRSIVILWPLQSIPNCEPESCCQLRRLYNSLEDTRVSTTLLTPLTCHDAAELRILNKGCERCHRHGAVFLTPAEATLA